MKKSHFTFISSLTCFALLSLKVMAQEKTVTPYISQNIPTAALDNILKSERVFCYTVEMAPENYTGYTLDQMALTGYCGQLGEEKEVFIDEFFKKPSNISQKTAECQIEPKIVLRFIRGIDMTDVLFSDTCPSVTVFYGGTFKSFNARSAKKSLEAVSAIFSAGRVDFISPALLNQLMPMGVILNDQDKATVNRQNNPQPVRSWNTDDKSPQENTPRKTAPQGWNKLKN